MPIIVKDYEWEENNRYVCITVPLKGVKTSKVDITSTDEYLKVTFPPYFFECLLADSVVDASGSALIGNGVVFFKLEKKVHGLWGHLQSPYSENKKWMSQKRQEALEVIQKKAEMLLKEKDEQKRGNEKMAIQEMMKLEEQERNRIENHKQEVRDMAALDLEKWKDEQRMLAAQEKERLLHENMEKETFLKDNDRQQRRGEVMSEDRLEAACCNDLVKGRSIFTETAEMACPGQQQRQAGTIVVNFTKRVFPTPIRESTKHLEDEWLRKQAKAREVADLQDNDLTEEEKNPQFLKDKGKAACHLRLRNLFKCTEDCSKALDLLCPPVPQNASSRMKALVRRGTAFCQLEMYVEGLMDYDCALKIEPNNQELRQDAEKMRGVIQSSNGT